LDVSDSAPSLLWLTGVPGSGKSSIAASMVRKFKDERILFAQFFFSRVYDTTSNPDYIFPSVANQLAERSSEAASAIHDALKKQISLVDKISLSQAEQFFVVPIKELVRLNPSQIVLIVIDAFDECDSKRLRETAKIISTAISHLPRNAKVLISSRVEDKIQDFFCTVSPKCIDLDTASSVEDVSKFLRGQIEMIVEEQGWSDWPGEKRMQELCNQSSGLFIWAVTATKFIRAEIEVSGEECLDEILVQLNAEGMADINELYNTILLQPFTGRKHDDWTFERFRRIIGALVVLQVPLCVADLKELLSLRQTETSPPADIKHFVRLFRTVLVAGIDAIDGKTVPRFHKSFFDFITSERVDPRFRVDMVASNEELAVQCLRQLNTLPRDICKIEHLATFNAQIPDLSAKVDEHIPVHVQYACQFWSLHLPSAKVVLTRAVKLRELFRDFYEHQLLHWLEATSLLNLNSTLSLLERAVLWATVRFSLLLATCKPMTSFCSPSISVIKIF
jgi:adenylate kinase